MPRKVDVPEGHPYRGIGGLVTAERTRAELDDIFQFDQNNLERNDVEVNRTGRTATVDKTRYMTDEEFETYRERASASSALGFSGSRKEWVVDPGELDSANPLRTHTNRARETMENDKNRKATVTTDPELYASDPERYDYPYLDTPPSFENEIQSTFDPAGEILRKAGDDGLFKF